MEMTFVLIYFAKVFLAISTCCPFYSSESGGECYCQGSWLLADSKLCVDGCPSLFLPTIDQISGSALCTAPGGDGGILFNLKLSNLQDLSSTFISDSINPDVKFVNSDSLPYKDQGELTPLPTIDRGFYFVQFSRAISDTSFVPALYFTLNLWIKPLDPGEILNVISSSNQYLMIETIDLNLYRFHALIYDSNGASTTITATSEVQFVALWQRVSVVLSQISCNEVTVSFYLNDGAAGLTTFTNKEARFTSLIAYNWILGSSGGQNTFRGFIYWLQASSDTIISYAAWDHPIDCIEKEFWTGSSCQGCLLSCSLNTWPWCVRDSDCSYCYSRDCSACNGYSLSMCTACSTGILPGCCDYLGETCQQTWQNSICKSNAVLVDGICLRALPYGLNSQSSVSNPVLKADFTGPFAGSYGTDLITGESSSSYYFWNTPETSDPIPAKNRGLYFNSNQYLSGDINFSYTWSMAMWVYPIMGVIISYSSSNLFSISYSGLFNFYLEKWDGAIWSGTNSNSVQLSTWNLISYSVEFKNKVTSVTPYINNVAGSATNVEDSVFRLPPGKLYIGSGETNYKGFIAYFILWQIAISDFSALLDISTLTSGSISAFWPCSFSSYYNQEMELCQDCPSSCLNGCTQEGSCNICDNLCAQCSSFLSGVCNLCVDNASGTPCVCLPGFSQDETQSICSFSCHAGCSSCSDSSYNSCLSCSSGYFPYHSTLCLLNCPSGYSENTATNTCDFISNTVLSIDFYDQINLDSIGNVKVGSDDMNKYPSYDAKDPYPAYQRGYYFTGTSYLSTNIEIGPYFSVSIWVNIKGYGTMLDKNMSQSNILCLKFLSDTLSPELSLILNGSTAISVTLPSNLILSGWNFIAFTGKIDSGNVYTITPYANSVSSSGVTSSSLTYFIDSISDTLFIGSKTDLSNGFSGFLYSLNIFNSESLYNSDYETDSCPSPCTQCSSSLICFDTCSITTFLSGSSCLSCKSTCNGCRYSDSCGLCKTKQCLECTSFSGTCTTCIPNAESDGSGGCQCMQNYFWDSSTASCVPCDVLCSSCVQNSNFQCSVCANGKTLVGSICLNDCPYGYGSGCSEVSNSVIDQVFDGDFTGSYGIFTAGTSPATYQPFSSPEAIDPIPAYKRGLYFDGNMYLLSSTSVYISHDFAMGIWFYPITNGDFVEKMSRIRATSNGSAWVTAEGPQQTTNEYILTTSPSSFTVWTYFSFSVNYDSGTTYLVLYLNGANCGGTLFANKVFRDQASTNLKIGKSSSSGFVGFIYYFQLWNVKNGFFNILNTFTFCGSNQGASCLWACDILQFEDTTNYSDCSSCSKGCRRPYDCNLCDDQLCAVCSGFETGQCSSCVSNASFDTGHICQCSQDYQKSSDGLSCVICATGCQNCNGNEFYQCTSCSPGYYFLNIQCLSHCPWGYSENSSTNNCDPTEYQTLSFQFDNSIELGSISGWMVGSSENSYPYYDANDPYPAYLRGYYFLSDKYLTTNFMIPPTFSISIWVQPIADGYIIGKYIQGITWYIKVIETNGNPKLSLTLSDSSTTLSNRVTTSNIINSGWVFLSFDCSIGTDGYTTLKSYLNGILQLTSSNSDNSLYPLDNVPGDLYVGHATSGFTGFIWNLYIYTQNNNALTDFKNSGCSGSCTFCPTNLSCPDNCPITAYFDGSTCVDCVSGASKGCRNSDTSRLCKTKECETCTEFTGSNSCLTCITNAVKDENGDCICSLSTFWIPEYESCERCDNLCATCLKTGYFDCSACEENYLLIGGVCLNDCPYGFDAPCSQVSHTVINLSFNTEFQGSYDDFTTGTSSESFYHFNSPEPEDPIPAYGRGLFFNGDAYLLSGNPVVFSHSFSVGAWLYVIDKGDWMEKQDQRLTFSTIGSIIVKMEDPTQGEVIQNISPQSTYSDWAYLAVTFEYTSGQTNIKFFINDISSSFAFQYLVFRDFASSSLMIGKSSLSSFVGFIKSFMLWNAPINDFSTYINDALCGTGLGHNCLWSCDLSSYWNGDTCLECDSCDYGCVRAGTCNICDDPLCLECSGFTSVDCVKCIDNASGAPDSCICNQGYWVNSYACIPCENFLSQSSVTASFSTDYSQIQFNFNVPADASEACCSCLFDSATSQSFGTGYLCSFAEDYNSLTVILGKGYTFSKESVVFLSGVLKNSALVCGNAPNSFSVPVSLPSPIPTPSFTFSAPKTLSSLCETLKVSAVLGNDLPYEQFKWTFSSTPANSVISAYSTQYSSTYSDITIPQSSLTDSILSVTFSAKNNFESVNSATQYINVTSSLFLKINFNDLSSSSISTSKSYSISISSIEACTISSSISVTWEIGQITNNITSVDEVSLRGNQTSQYALIIPPKVFPASSNITFIFHAKDLVYLSEGEASLMLQTDVSNPVTLFNRTDGPIGVSQDLVIDASSSYDPDGESQLSFQWSCWNDVTDCSSFILNSYSSLLKISGSTLSVGVTYNLTLILTKTTLNTISTTVKVSKSIFITAQQGTVPSVNIVEVGNSNVGIVNPEQAYRIQAQGSFTSILWSVNGDLPILFSSPLNYASLVIAQNSLLAGSTYTLEALINKNFVFTWTFYVNQGPKGGSLAVTPGLGYEMTTQFTIEALNWEDPEDNIPLEYAYGYLINDNYQVISSKNFSSLIYSTFPYSSQQIMISVDVYDSLLSKTTSFQSITVLINENADVNQYVDDITTQLNSPDLNPISIPKLISDLSSLSLNRNYIVSGDYSEVDQQIQDSYNLAIDKITSYTQNTNPYDPSTYTTIFNMLKIVTSNPNINNYDNIEKISDVIKEIFSNLDGKVQLDDTQVQTFLGICNNNFQVNSSAVANQTNTISSIEGNIKSISSAVLTGMSSRESKVFLDEKISLELSMQPNSMLSNFSSEIMGASIILASNTENFVSNDYVGTSLALYDPLSDGANASFSLVSFTLTDLSTRSAIPLNNTNYNYISIPVQFSNNSSNATVNCTYLEESQDKWKIDGCVLDSFNTTTIICKCSHLSIFSAFFGGASDTAQSSNIGETVNVNAFSSIDWDTNAIGLYFCTAILIFYIVLLMLACKLDKKTEEEQDIEESPAQSEENSKKVDEFTEKSEDLTYRTDDSIVHTYRHKIGYDPSIASTMQNSSQEISRTDSITSVQSENIEAKPTKKRVSFFEFVGKNHDFISIFLPDRLFSHNSRVTAYTVSLLGNMFFIGLFYQDGEKSDDDSESMSFTEAVNNYSFRDFWVMVYSSGIMIPIIIILRTLAKRSVKSNSDQEKQNKMRKIEKWKKFVFYFISWSLMGYFCWSVILFSIQFQLNLTYKWICNTSVSYGSDIFVMPFVKMPIKVFMVWIITKMTMALGFSSSKHKTELE